VKETTRVFCVFKQVGLGILHETPVVEDARQPNQLYPAKVIKDFGRCVHAVSIEANPRSSDRNSEVQVAAGCQNSREFGGGSARAIRIQRITVTPKADVFCYVKTRYGFQCGIPERQRNRRASYTHESVQAVCERSIINENNRHEGGQKIDEIYV